LKDIEEWYELARRKYAEFGVDTDDALAKLAGESISIQCWQGDDVRGFEAPHEGAYGGGIMATGNYPGRARNAKELRADLDEALSLIPGMHRVNIHAMYGEFGNGTVDRNEIEPEHFAGWVEWAKNRNLGLDFNPTLFSHPMANSGFTLSSKDLETRGFWIEHVKRCREIAAYIGRELGSPCVHNLWIPDGMKDACVHRYGYREILKESLDEIYSKKYDSDHIKDSVEPKLFGIGSESYVVGSHEFYLGYALSRGLIPCLDLGHFHPTESVADKISSILQFSRELVLHISRGVRWDSDHVPVFDDQVREVFHELVRSDALGRVQVALDYFDASINRVGAWVTGSRATLKSMLYALLEPTERLVDLEKRGRYFERLAFLEELKAMPLGSVWDYHCLKSGVPVGDGWVSKVLQYEKNILENR
jgi:L-rhamnose isomerase